MVVDHTVRIRRSFSFLLLEGCHHRHRSPCTQANYWTGNDARGMTFFIWYELTNKHARKQASSFGGLAHLSSRLFGVRARVTVRVPRSSFPVPGSFVVGFLFSPLVIVLVVHGAPPWVVFAMAAWYA